MTQTVGQRPDNIDCPGSLKGEVGNKMRCVLTEGQTRLGVTLRVKSVKDGKINFTILVDQKRMSQT